MDKLDFLEAYPEAWKQAFTLDNIKSGFTATLINPVMTMVQLRT